MSQKGWTLKELATKTASLLEGSEEIVVSGAAELDSATPQDAAFLAHSRHHTSLQHTQAGVIFLKSDTPRPAGKNYLIHTDPAAAFDLWTTIVAQWIQPLSGFTGIHPTAVIHETANLAEEVQIGPYAVVDRHVTIGPRTRIGPGTLIGPEATIGSDCTIHGHVVVEARSHLGDRIVIHSGAVIGSCGFGLRLSPEGKHKRLPHLGNVHLHDDVEIGANTTVDRARLSSTVIGQGTKIDNLVQIAHNVKLGKHNLIIAQVGIAGSSTTGDYVVLAGQVGVSDHVSIASHVMVAACSGIANSIDKPGKYSGIPAVSAQESHRQLVHLRNLSKYVQQLKQLQKEVEELKG
jgi:UDP-3-O-[3-hydroxymyristoyl] glucosamine N-acyltransferase